MLCLLLIEVASDPDKYTVELRVHSTTDDATRDSKFKIDVKKYPKMVSAAVAPDTPKRTTGRNKGRAKLASNVVADPSFTIVSRKDLACKETCRMQLSYWSNRISKMISGVIKNSRNLRRTKNEITQTVAKIAGGMISSVLSYEAYTYVTFQLNIPAGLLSNIIAVPLILATLVSLRLFVWPVISVFFWKSRS